MLDEGDNRQLFDIIHEITFRHAQVAIRPSSLCLWDSSDSDPIFRFPGSPQNRRGSTIS